MLYNYIIFVVELFIGFFRFSIDVNVINSASYTNNTGVGHLYNGIITIYIFYGKAAHDLYMQ